MVSKGRQRERDLAASPRAKQGTVVYVEGGAKGDLARRARGDRWQRPPGAKDSDLCFMAVVMETWCLAELDESQKDLEKVEKAEVYDQLTLKTQRKWDSRQKAASFDWLEKVNAQRLRQRCPEFDRTAKRRGAA